MFNQHQLKTNLRSLFVSIVLIYSSNIYAQNEIEPGSKLIYPSLIKLGTFTWGWFENERSDVGQAIVRVEKSSQHIIFVRQRVSKKLDINEKDSVVFNNKTFAPVYRSFRGEEVSYNLQYTNSIKGTRTIFETNKKEPLNTPFDGKFFDEESLPFVISCLPLNNNFQAIIPVVRYDSEFKPIYYRYKITSVEDIETVSAVSGRRSVWKVSTKEKKHGLEYIIYIDKSTRRILRFDITFSDAIYSSNYFDKETDVNPIKAKFSSSETLDMITKGNSVVKGTVYFKGYGKQFKDSRDRKKQYAEKGSTVALIPNTPYFKEWVDYNLKLSKLTGPVYTIDWGGLMGQQGEKDRTVIGTYFPLPDEVTKCILVTTISDDKGGFAFQNLQPGEYLLFASFTADQYSHTTKEYKGTEVTLNNDGTISSRPLWDIQDWTTPGNVRAHKFVTVKKENETVSVKIND